MKVLSGLHQSLELLGGAIAVKSIGALQVVEYLENLLEADTVSPGQWAQWIVNATLHGGIRARGITNLLQYGVGRLIGEHADSAHDQQPGNVIKYRDALADGLEKSYRLGQQALMHLLSARARATRDDLV